MIINNYINIIILIAPDGVPRVQEKTRGGCQNVNLWQPQAPSLRSTLD